MPTIDYDSFQKRLVSGLRAAWQKVRAQRPSETFYMFGVETDSDATVLTPFCNTEEQFAAEHGTPEYPIEKWAVDQDSQLYGAGAEHTAELQQEVNQFVMADGQFVFVKQSDPGYAERKARLMQIFERALAELDAEGFFGRGDERRKVALSVEIVDADEDEWNTMIEIMKRLNPPESIEPLLRLLEAQEAEEE
ncbi:MAG TPA: DUF4303 domain-containing protein [Pirellulales bacterium]|nr:DUF4303 domain-containing protein [Pirellulales bacterium]